MYIYANLSDPDLFLLIKPDTCSISCVRPEESARSESLLGIRCHVTPGL